MKCLLLFFVFTAIYTNTGAQQTNAELQQKLQAILDKQKGNNDFVLKEDGSIVVPYKAKKAETNKRSGVYSLPQDGMPCIVPDTKNIAAIPNAFVKKETLKLGQIPNATPQTGQQLKKNQRLFFAPLSR